MKPLKKGELVEMTAEAVRMFPSAEHTGKVTSLIGGKTIRVRRSGLKASETWHESYWKRRTVERTEP